MFRGLIFIFLLGLIACDNTRVFENNHDFENGEWSQTDTVAFEFTVPDTVSNYNVLLNVRNTIDFNTARFFVQYRLADSIKTFRNRLVEENLFDRITGKPFGDSGLGNIYAHQFLLEPGIKLSASGKYKVRLNHMMRYDALPEIRSVGIRVERTAK